MHTRTQRKSQQLIEILVKEKSVGLTLCILFEQHKLKLVINNNNNNKQQKVYKLMETEQLVTK